MKYRILQIIIFVIMFLLFTIMSWGLDNPPTGFHGIKWGTSVEKIDNLKLVKKNESANEDIYIKQDDVLTIGSLKTPVTSIEYHFYKNQFYQTTIDFKSFSNYSDIYGELYSKYGEPEKASEDNIVSLKSWGKGIYIQLVCVYMETNDYSDCSVSYTNTKIKTQDSDL